MTATLEPIAPRKSVKYVFDEIDFMRHQIEGVRRMCRMSGAILADEMGLGKTLQALTVAAIALQERVAQRVLVVSPATLKGNWKDECTEFTTFTKRVLSSKMDSAARIRFLHEFRLNPSQVLIVNYEQVVAHQDLLNAIGFQFVIFDEAHMIKGHKAKRTRACFNLIARRKFVLTGSPILNQADDLWALLHIVDPREWPDYWRFRNRYCAMGGFKGKQIVGIMNEAELRQRIQPYLIQRYKKDCLDLPEIKVIPVKLDLSPAQRKLYDQAADEMKIDVPNADPMEISNVLVKFLKLKQICGTTATIEGLADDSAKLDRAEEMALEIISNGKPLVVFTQFRGVLHAFEHRLTSKYGIPTYVIHGDVDADSRKPIVDQWTIAAQNGMPGVLIAMYQVGGTGLTMTAASDVFRLDKLFAPKLNQQAVDRLHRIGQTSQVFAYDFLMRNTVETRVERILKQKNAVIDALETKSSDWNRQIVAAAMEADAEDE